MSQSKPYHIPHELYRDIVEALPFAHGGERRIDSSLLALACTSRVFQVEAERIIYSNLDFNNRKVNAPDINRVLHDRAAIYVVNLSIYGDQYLNLPFERMEKLRSLTILPLESHPISDLFGSLQKNLAPNVLRKFTVAPSAFDALLTGEHLAFLGGQSDLRELCLPSCGIEQPLACSFLPNIDVADLGLVSPTEICHLISSRPIRSLACKISHPNFSNMAFDGACLKILDVRFTNLFSRVRWMEFLESMVTDCPSLRLLSIEIPATSILKIIQNESFHAVINLLERWSQLEAFSLAIQKPSWLYLWLALLSQRSRLSNIRSILLWGGLEHLDFGVELRRDHPSKIGTEWIEYPEVKVSEWRKTWKSKALDSSLSSPDLNKSVRKEVTV
ncbi:hypothetical protein SISNIDRAFT_535586 [Sistotremastrum niveocremeum HHB9708]|uniref:F-box domain-containing protein n=1 Tax=Sistotremastrum niveocremeum HHB9708 TaxID=1314777 RepID=A0A164NA57_9AGAM|nr:hypothetical protein SISNIDRAFT_535586 [Sistotremastrum niveocremeum HHB9708]